ncbi:O-antigen ligase family protein [Cryobacterium luteum]|uniref:O-antigen ligase domain-containing protein n=1 Tax=Cryobacterium luteum TaxID=1424661 RepID=A0A1H8CGI2_9MICO|nr:O-antigen ligase family protein [Cryobacterium luteum]TFB89346.1 O-antigen ligase domain-containing protein [Cryobacterium luteum]SEM93388.1 O-Antigen ligase [Cryobacterium luteum]
MSVSPAAIRRISRQRADGRTRDFDGLTLLTVYLVLLFAVPSNLAFTALGSAGRPASLWAMFAGLWWCWWQVQRPAQSGWKLQPVRFAVFGLLIIGALSYSTALLRGLPADEANPADNGMLRLAAWAGILLVANDGLRNSEMLHRLLRRITWAVAILAVVGIAQFVTGNPLIDWISIPGMSSDLAVLDSRGGFVRASATASQPLEYGVVLCLTFPLAIVLALEDTTRTLIARWLPAALIAIASVLSVSRSELVGLLIGLVVLFPSFSGRARLVLGALGVLLAGMTAVLVPGLLGTIRGLFTGIAADPSTVSRTSSYDAAVELVSRFPLVGKGFGTLLARYHIFDNQYLLLAIELGLLGLIVFLTLLITALVSAGLARERATTRIDRQLARALLASALSGAVMLAFFDGLSFPMSAGMLFLVLGLCGAALRLFSPVGAPASAQSILTR